MSVIGWCRLQQTGQVLVESLDFHSRLPNPYKATKLKLEKGIKLIILNWKINTL